MPSCAPTDPLQAAAAYLAERLEAQKQARAEGGTAAPPPPPERAVMGGTAQPLGDWALFLGGAGGRVPAPRRRRALEEGEEEEGGSHYGYGGDEEGEHPEEGHPGGCWVQAGGWVGGPDCWWCGARCGREGCVVLGCPRQELLA